MKATPEWDVVMQAMELVRSIGEPGSKPAGEIIDEIKALEASVPEQHRYQFEPVYRALVEITHGQ